MIPLTVKELFQQEFDAIFLEDKIQLAEQISFCILKKIENQTTHKLKLICSKQKCQFSIKLELSPIENKYYLRDLHAEHNHHISKEKFEEKMLTGRLLKFSDFIYKNYFLHESEFCSKPKLILKDLKSKHNLDILSGSYSAAQKQKLKKKFDNIVQQLRLKKNRAMGICDSIPTSTGFGSSVLLPQFASSVGCDGLNSSMQLPSIPLQNAKKGSSSSYPTRDAAQSLSTALQSIGDSTNKSSKKRITSGSSSNFDFQNADTMNQTCVYSPSQNNPSTPQMIASQKGTLPPFAMLNHAGLVNPNFQLILQQQYLIQQNQLQQQQQQQQQQLLQQQNAMKKMSPQVISEDSRSASFCKVEDFGEGQSAASANNLDLSVTRKQLQTSPAASYSTPMNALHSNLLLQMPVQQQQAFAGNANVASANGLPAQLLSFPTQTFDFNVHSSTPQASVQSQQTELMMQLQENKIQQEKIKHEEFQLKMKLQQQQQQIQQQQQLLNPLFFLQAANLSQQNLMSNPQLMLLLQNQQALAAAAACNGQATIPNAAQKMQQAPLTQGGLYPLLAANPNFAAFGNATGAQANLIQALPEQSLLMNQTDLAANQALRGMQVSPFFPNSGMIPTTSA